MVSDATGGVHTLLAYGQITQAPEVVEALGTNPEMIGLPVNNETETTKTGTLELKGPKGTGTAVLIQEKQPDGKWKIQSATFTPAGGAPVELKIQDLF